MAVLISSMICTDKLIFFIVNLVNQLLNRFLKASENDSFSAPDGSGSFLREELFFIELSDKSSFLFL
jgi:hypothetical protein